MFRQQHRNEDFGHIVALADGSVCGYGPGAPIESLGQHTKASELAPYRLSPVPADSRLRAPIFMTVELTLRCNLTCSHCYISAGAARDNELRTEEILELLTRIRELGVFFVFLTGGEPTLRPDFAQILHHAYDVGLDVNVLTNASSFNDRLLSSIPDTTTFVVSVDGLDAHAAIRGNQTFDQVTRRIDFARRRNFPVLTNTTVNKVNLRDLPALYDWAERERIVLVSLDLNNVGRGNDNASFLFLDDADVPAYLDFIDRKVEFDRMLEDLYEETFGGPRVFSNPFYYSFAEECIRATATTTKATTTCTWPPTGRCTRTTSTPAKRCSRPATSGRSRSSRSGPRPGSSCVGATTTTSTAPAVRSTRAGTSATSARPSCR